ncbi:SIMPL domain-containing protein [Halomicrobium salinisoli]|uniref:SIMPL domain-containing protein n=1 Tax=Halomicrobium salinisoli TaxID=2878391 RepID=UPI001CF06193|nr:SIMPL domain-containing protein [Halomicrobium salinisoli]
MDVHRQRLLSVAVTAAVVAALAVVPAAPAAAQDAGNDASTDVNASVTTVSVSASDEAAGEPMTAVVYVESAATGDTPAEATTALARNVTQLRAALTDATVSEDQFRTTGYDLQQVRPDEPDGPVVQRPANGTNQSAVTYRASQSFELVVDNRSRVGELVDVAVANGATAIGGVQFRLADEDREALRQEALQQAMERARTEAETLAGTEGLTITGVESISTSQQFYQSGGGAVALEQADAGTTIDSGPITVRADVQVTYEAEAE